MALTGLFIITFLIGHLVGNLQLFYSDGGQAFNEYAKFMTSHPFIKVLSILTYTSIVVHVIYSIILTRHNLQARPIKYAYNRRSENSLWNSRNMGILGTLLFIFIIIHMRSFWYIMHWGPIEKVDYGGGEINDIYTVVVMAFSAWWYVLFYVLSMGFLAFHLAHGFKSAFQTLGLSHVKYTPLLKSIGYSFAIIVPAIFAAMPLYLYLKNL